MKILVINTGSSSIKYQLFNMEQQSVLCSGIVEKIGEKTGSLTYKAFPENSGTVSKTYNEPIPDHEYGFSRIVSCLMSKEFGVIADRSEISAVGHRVVHGGTEFYKPLKINKKNLWRRRL